MLLPQTSKPLHGLVFSYKGDTLASLSHKKILVWNLKLQRLEKHAHRRELSSIASSSTQDLIATADVSGRIILWYGTATEGEAVRCATMHWHAHKVHP